MDTNHSNHNAKRTKLEEMISEELRWTPNPREQRQQQQQQQQQQRPASHSSHFDDQSQQPPKKPQDKRITELLAENMQEQLILHSGHQVVAAGKSSTGTGTGTGTGTVDYTKPTAMATTIPTVVAPMEGDIPQLSLHSSFYVQGVKIGWPFPVVMPPQRQMALHLIKALKTKKHVVLESPTGTGKSAAILCAVLAWHRYHEKQRMAASGSSSTTTTSSSASSSKTTTATPATPTTSNHHQQEPLCKIIYCSRTHSQVAQMISSLRKTPYRPRMAVLGSRNHLCIHDQVRASGNINTECRVRVGNTDEMRKRQIANASTFYDDEEPPMSLPQDVLESATATTTAVATTMEDDNDEGRQSSKACCAHYRQLGPKRTAQLAHQCFVPSCGSKGGSGGTGGALTKQGTADVEDLVQFGRDPYRKRGVAVYRDSDGKKPFGMTVVEQQGRIHVAQIHRNSPSSKTALDVGDEILEINGTAVDPHSSIDDIARRIGQTPPNQPLVVDATSNSNFSVRPDDDETASPHAPCPYYLARSLAKTAELVFCPYNYVLDPSIRNSLGLDLENAVVVLDEAHNVEDVLRQAGSGKFGEFELCEIVVMLQFYASALKSPTKDVEDKKDLRDCAHELLVFGETILHFMMDSKLKFERQKATKVLEDWNKFKTPDETEFDITFDGPNGHGVRGKAVGCATFFEKLAGTKMDSDALKRNVEAMEAHIRSKQDFAKDKYSSALDKLGELITMLSYASEHTEHYYIATVAKANGNLEFASGQMMTSSSNNRFQRKPQRIPLIPPRKGNDTASLRTPPDVCLHAHCRAVKTGPMVIGGHVRHGDYCNGSQPPWEAWLVIELLTPARFFADLRKQCRTIVLASGSLAPIPSLCAELGLEGKVDAKGVLPVKTAAKMPYGSLVGPAVVNSNNKRSNDKMGIKAESADAKPGETKEEVPEVPRLQIQPKPLEANHVIDLEKQLLAVSCGYFTDGSPLTVNYSNWSKGNFLEKLGDAIATVIEAIPTGGVLIFLPSYSFLRKCIAKWKPSSNSWEESWTGNQDSSIWDRLITSKGKIIVEPTGSQSQFEMARDEYASTISGTGSCILFAVFRGKMSEGISFNDDNARGVICVGIPYPNAYDRSIKAKKNYNDEQRRIHGRKDVLPGNEWYSQQAYRAIAQALGRCIRHAADYGTVVLMDSRHCDDGGPRDGDLCRAHQKLPKWMRYQVKNLSKSHTGDLYAKSIPGGWAGLQLEMNRFFAEAPAHGRIVLDQQTKNLQKSQAQSSRHHFNVNTGSWTPTATPLEDSWGRQKESAATYHQRGVAVAVTPQSPAMVMYDLTSDNNSEKQK